MSQPNGSADPAGQSTDPNTEALAGDPPTPQPPKEPKAGDPPKSDEPLGETGLRALQVEREARKSLEEQLKALAPLQKLAEALGADGSSKADPVATLEERLSTHERQLAEERSARWRAEVAHEKGLTPKQAARLQGSTRDELESDADELLSTFPVVPKAPQPDPSQGSRGGAGVDIDAQIEEAQKSGNWRRVIALQNQKLANAG